MLTDVAGHVEGDPSVHGIGAKTKLYLHTLEEAPDGTHDNIVTFCTGTFCVYRSSIHFETPLATPLPWQCHGQY